MGLRVKADLMERCSVALRMWEVEEPGTFQNSSAKTLTDSLQLNLMDPG